MESKVTCPQCHLNFEAALPETGVLVCPLCNSVFSALAPPGLDPTVSPPPSSASGRQVLRGVLAVGALFFLAGGLGYTYHLLGGLAGKSAAPPTPTASAPPAPSSSPSVEIIPTLAVEATPPAPAPEAKPSLRPPERQPLAIAEEARRPLSLEERANAAIDRGVAYLRKHYPPPTQYRPYLGLLGLTLLECGIAADDATVRQIAVCIRAQLPQIVEPVDLMPTILFFDRLGDPRDRPLIQVCGQRLLASQLDCGGWASPQERRRLALWMRLSRRPVPPRSNPDLFRQYAESIRALPGNECTQCAVLGLWVAQRHGVPARSALLTTALYCRQTQLSNGAWGYESNAIPLRDGRPTIRVDRSRGSNAFCAGLMSLAISHGFTANQGRGIRPDHPLRVHDDAIQRALRYLALAFNHMNIYGERIVVDDRETPLFLSHFLWWVQCMADIYDLQKIGEQEWYPHAAQLLLEAQLSDGQWPRTVGPLDTCYALLVLKRSNVAKDLRLTLQAAPSRPLPDLSAPTIVQGPDAFLGQSGKPRHPTALPGTASRPGPSKPLGPSIARPPDTK